MLNTDTQNNCMDSIPFVRYKFPYESYNNISILERNVTTAFFVVFSANVHI